MVLLVSLVVESLASRTLVSKHVGAGQRHLRGVSSDLYAATGASRNPSARITFTIVPNSGFPSGLRAL